MKVFVVLCLASLVLGHGDKEFKKWAKTKAMESCFGEENMKIWTVQMKKAVAKCTQQDAPELFLPQFRAPYKTVNALLEGNDNRDSGKFRLMYQFFRLMQQYQQNQYSNNYHQARPSSNDYNMKNGQYQQNQYSNNYHQARPYSNDYNMKNGLYQQNQYSNNYHQAGPNSNDYNMKDDMVMPMKWVMKMMIQNNEQSHNGYQNMDMHKRTNSDHMNDRMNNLEHIIKNAFYKKESNDHKFSDMFDVNHDIMSMFNHRYTREAHNSLDLGDRLVEKLQAQKEEMEHKVGNLTCILQEVNVLDSQNEISLPALKKDMQQYKLSAWFRNHYEDLLDTCYKIATTLPAEINEEYAVVGHFGKINMAQIKTFTRCSLKEKAELCMNYDIKKKIEDNFGPVDDVLEQSGLTESQLFPLVFSLMHGQEEYLEDLL